jgi:monofunctional biosynthetic peptidoglycan transglycosylase
MHNSNDRIFRFDRIAGLGLVRLICVGILAFGGGAVADGERRTVMDLQFDGAVGEPVWVAQNDDVMGGVSKGGTQVVDGVLVFTGSLSLENNGGFAQVEIRNLGADLSGKQGVKLRVRGDGRTYQLRLATNARHRGSRIAYRAEFPTRAGEWIDVVVPFADLEPSHHGNMLDGPPVDLSQVEEIGLLLGDGLAGPFLLEVDWMRAE